MHQMKLVGCIDYLFTNDYLVHLLVTLVDKGYHTVLVVVNSQALMKLIITELIHSALREQTIWLCQVNLSEILGNWLLLSW